MKNFLILIAFFLTAASGRLMAQSDDFPYDLKQPHEIHLLPEFLEEVSGLTHYGPDQIAALNDEHGRMYVYDIAQKKIVLKVRFEGNGDFE